MCVNPEIVVDDATRDIIGGVSKFMVQVIGEGYPKDPMAAAPLYFETEEEPTAWDIPKVMEFIENYLQQYKV